MRWIDTDPLRQILAEDKKAIMKRGSALMKEVTRRETLAVASRPNSNP